MDFLLLIFILGSTWAMFGWVYALGFLAVAKFNEYERPYAGFKHYLVGVFVLAVIPLIIQASKGAGVL